MPIQLHSWEVGTADARALQSRLRERVIARDDLSEVRAVAGSDVGFESGGSITRAAVAVLSFPDLELLDSAVARRPTRFPYVPGLLSFREIPALLDAFERIRRWPDLVLCDGQGYAHPRRFGLACHMGLWLDTPTIGVAKSRLLGDYIEPAVDKGAHSALLAGGEVIGSVVRTRAGVRPLFVSTGHRVALPTAVHYVLNCTTRFRLPETTRWAHRLASG